MFEKKYLIYIYECKQDIWNIAIFSNIHLLIKDQFLTETNKNLDSKPNLHLLITNKTEIIDQNFYESFFQSINRYVLNNQGFLNNILLPSIMKDLKISLNLS